MFVKVTGGVGEARRAKGPEVDVGRSQPAHRLCTVMCRLTAADVSLWIFCILGECVCEWGINLDDVRGGGDKVSARVDWKTQVWMMDAKSGSPNPR